MLCKPALALREALRVRVHLVYRVEPARAAHEALMDRQHHFAAHARGGRKQQIEGASDRAFGGVLDRDDGVLGGARFDLPEHVIDRCAGGELYRAAEMLEGGFLAVGALGPEESDRHLVFERAARRHDFGIDALDRAVGEWAGIQVGHAPQDLRLAFGPVDRSAVLDVAHALREARTLGKKLHEARIERVDFFAQVFERVSQGRSPIYRAGR